MSRFDDVVQEALRERPDLTVLRPVVEKEVLHHDILREMGNAGLLRDLVFMGGTCLRLCHGSPRLSEDLDFTTALEPDFLLERLSSLGPILETGLYTKYQLPVAVSEPKQIPGLVRTWKVQIITRPGRADLPRQRIHIDIQALPARDAQPILPRNPYRVEMGTSGLIIVASSLSEILADKLIAVALRENRIKWRDLWDIAWLTQRDVAAERSLTGRKAADRGLTLTTIEERVNERISKAEPLHREFVGEMNRFLPPGDLRSTVNDPRYWEYLMRLVPTLIPAG
jgi:predicted nucleotidyltransferase component of viral defense system